MLNLTHFLLFILYCAIVLIRFISFYFLFLSCYKESKDLHCFKVVIDVNEKDIKCFIQYNVMLIKFQYFIKKDYSFKVCSKSFQNYISNHINQNFYSKQLFLLNKFRL